MGKYFGTDGIRGVAGEFLNADLAYNVGRSLKYVLEAKTIVIGRDTRESSEKLALEVAKGATELGVSVLDAGVVSTPMVAYYSKKETIVGVMITASHNPYTDNGIKLFQNGSKLSEDQEKTIEKYLEYPLQIEPEKEGTYKKTKDVQTAYLDLYKRLKLVPINLSIGYDSANGANYQIAKEVLEPLCDESVQINAEPNGKNINMECGSTHLEAIQKLVKEKNLDIGFSFDGDGDRCIAVDHCGDVVDGDLMIYAIAKYLKKKDKLAKNTVVLTKMSNPGIVKALKELGIKTVRTDVGDKYVSREILKNDYTLGGENSGHIILNDILHTGDGLLVAVYLLKVLQSTKMALRSYIEDVKMNPQKMVNIKDIDKKVLDTKDVKTAIKEAQKTLGPDSLLLVRPSGTEPVIRVTVSHESEDVVDVVIDQLVTAIKETGSDNHA